MVEGFGRGSWVVAKFFCLFRGLCVAAYRGNSGWSPRPFVSNRKSRSDRGERGVGWVVYVFGGGCSCIFNFADGAMGRRKGRKEVEGRAEREATAMVEISQDVSGVWFGREMEVGMEGSLKKEYI